MSLLLLPVAAKLDIDQVSVLVLCAGAGGRQQVGGGARHQGEGVGQQGEGQHESHRPASQGRINFRQINYY